ncbi:hypothetical protein Bbelb_340540 [Branchiostoma belcheri]|nr:hypothetical protein Bbelb_340540 [Branchiostoma belcheri]
MVSTEFRDNMPGELVRWREGLVEARVRTPVGRPGWRLLSVPPKAWWRLGSVPPQEGLVEATVRTPGSLCSFFRGVQVGRYKCDQLKIPPRESVTARVSCTPLQDGLSFPLRGSCKPYSKDNSFKLSSEPWLPYYTREDGENFSPRQTPSAAKPSLYQASERGWKE